MFECSSTLTVRCKCFECSSTLTVRCKCFECSSTLPVHYIIVVQCESLICLSDAISVAQVIATNFHLRAYKDVYINAVNPRVSLLFYLVVIM